MKADLPTAVKKIRESGRVPIGLLAYDPATDSVDVALCTDMMDIDEANALLSKFNLFVRAEEDGK